MSPVSPDPKNKRLNSGPSGSGTDAVAVATSILSKLMDVVSGPGIIPMKRPSMGTDAYAVRSVEKLNGPNVPGNVPVSW